MINKNQQVNENIDGLDKQWEHLLKDISHQKEYVHQTVDDLAKEGIVEEKRMILFDGNIITSNKDDFSAVMDLNVLANLQDETKSKEETTTKNQNKKVEGCRKRNLCLF